MPSQTRDPAHMVDDDAIDHLLVFRRPRTPHESATAHRLLERGPGRGSDNGVVLVYVLVDVEGAGSPEVEAAVEVSATPRSWRLRRAGGDQRHHPRLAAELIQVATRAGAAQLTAGSDAPRTVLQLMGTMGADIRATDRRFSFDL